MQKFGSMARVFSEIFRSESHAGRWRVNLSTVSTQELPELAGGFLGRARAVPGGVREGPAPTKNILVNLRAMHEQPLAARFVVRNAADLGCELGGMPTGHCGLRFSTGDAGKPVAPLSCCEDAAVR